MNTAAAASILLTLSQIHELEYAVWDHAILSNLSRGSRLASQRHDSHNSIVPAWSTISHGCGCQRNDYN